MVSTMGCSKIRCPYAAWKLVIVVLKGSGSIESRMSCCIQEVKGNSWQKRTPCLIVARHAQLPREVPVVCKQIRGVLLLGNVRKELTIRSSQLGNPTIMSTADFETAAGCSNGKQTFWHFLKQDEGHASWLEAGYWTVHEWRNV